MNPFNMGQASQPFNMMQGAGQGAGLPNMPVGAMAGAMQVQNQQRLEQFAEQQKQANLMSLTQQLMQMQEYQANAPWRQAERAAGIETANVNRDYVRRGRAAEVGQKELDLRKNTATEGSDIAATISGNETKISDNTRKRMTAFIEDIDAMGPMMSDPMTASVQTSDLLDRHSIPKNHPIRTMLQGARNPQEFQIMMQAIRQRMIQNLEYDRMSGIQSQKDTADYKRAIDVANIQANATMSAAKTRAEADKDLIFKNPNNAAAIAEQALTSLPENADLNSMSPDAKAAVNQMLQVYDRVLADKRAKVQEGIQRSREMMIAVTGGSLSVAQEKVLADSAKLQLESIERGAPAFYKKVRGLDKPATPTPTGPRSRPLSSF